MSRKPRALFLQWPALLAAGLLPVFTFFGVQGAVSLFRDTVYAPSVVAAATVLLLLCVMGLWLHRKQRRRSGDVSGPVDMVEANPAWGARQREIWMQSNAYIDELLERNAELEEMPAHSMRVLRRVASAWNRSPKHVEYAATLPEALLAIEVLSARYRQILVTNVPFSQDVKVSQVLRAWDTYESHHVTARYAYRAYRFYRAFSLSGVLRELASSATSPLSDQAFENLIYNLKRAYLQEVANVAVDLYSGNFRRAVDELDFDRDTRRDIDRLAETVGPIRILVVGQTSAGKSTLVNALLEQIRSESGLRPTTKDDTAYAFSPAGSLATHIIDTPGIEPGAKSISASVDKLSEADLVIWVMRANQPGRSIDQELDAAMRHYFDEHPDRQRPTVIAAATHIDRIPAFSAVTNDTLLEETQPLADACARAVTFDHFCPLSLEAPQIGVNSLREVIAACHEQAINTRLNRIRNTSPSLTKSARDELERLRSGTVQALKLALVKRRADEQPSDNEPHGRA